MNYSIKFGRTRLAFSLEKRPRKTLAIHVYPDKSIEVVAPKEASIGKIKSKVFKRAAWIIRKQIEFDRIHPVFPKPLFVSGETYRFLGQQYRLKLLHEDHESIQLKDKFIIVNLNDSQSPRKLKNMIIKWYRKQAQMIFNKRLAVCIKAVQKIGITEKPELTLRVMPKRWGSCTKKEKILLHPELVAAPRECIDYVITHELCHIKEHNHSNKYYELLTSIMPDWEKRKRRLNETIEVRLM